MSKHVKIVTPPLGHFDTFIPVVAAIVDTANSVAVTMGERSLDGVGMPEAAFVEHR